MKRISVLLLLVVLATGSVWGQDVKVIWAKDNSEMVLIPTGSFEMGDHWDGNSDALPVHTVELDAFCMDIHEVTVGRFRRFVNQSGYDYRGSWNEVARYSPTDNHPMIYVSWYDAKAYCDWSGKRLPTEAEWEYAARGGLVGKRYPWGNEINRTNAHYESWDSGNGTTKQVGSYLQNGHGLYDVGGNVIEWCNDWYDENYYAISPDKNPRGPKNGEYRIVRGGRWDNDIKVVRVAERSSGQGFIRPDRRTYSCGFRCVSEPVIDSSQTSLDQAEIYISN